jgi:hypothetical protein
VIASNSNSIPNIIQGENLASEMVGITPDSLHGNVSQMTYLSSLDWVDFANPFRSFGMDSTTGFSAASAQGMCSTGTCGIWDFALSASSAGFIRNTSGNGTSSNGVFTQNSACPAAANGNLSVNNPNTGAPYLLNAIEVLGSGGNDNGLCEAGETCIYAPNFGAYQGEGTFAPCIYAPSGGIAGVTLFGALTNGH